MNLLVFFKPYQIAWKTRFIRPIYTQSFSSSLVSSTLYLGEFWFVSVKKRWLRKEMTSPFVRNQWRWWWTSSNFHHFLLPRWVLEPKASHLLLQQIILIWSTLINCCMIRLISFRRPGSAKCRRRSFRVEAQSLTRRTWCSQLCQAAEEMNLWWFMEIRKESETVIGFLQTISGKYMRRTEAIRVKHPSFPLTYCHLLPHH